MHGKIGKMITCRKLVGHCSAWKIKQLEMQNCRELWLQIVPIAMGTMASSSPAFLLGEKQEHKELPVWIYGGIAAHIKNDTYHSAWFIAMLGKWMAFSILLFLQKVRCVSVWMGVFSF